MASDEERGILLEEGINVDKLLEGSHEPLFNISFSNRAVITLFRISGSSTVQLRAWLYRLAGMPDNEGSTDLVPKGNLSKRLEKLKKDLSALSKSKRLDERETLMKDKFSLPSLLMCRLPAASLVTSAVSAVSRAAVALAERETETRVAQMAEKTACAQLSQLSRSAGKLQTRLAEVLTEQGKSKRREMRAKCTVTQLRTTVASLRRSHKTLLMKSTAARSSLSILRRKMLRYENRQCSDCLSKDKQIAQLKTACAQKKDQIAMLQETVRERDFETDRLKECLIEAESETISAKEGASYSAEMRECILRLQALNVAQGKVGQVISTVLQCLVGKQLDAVPSRRTIARSLPLGLALSHQQIAAKISSATSSTLYSDETTKGATKLFTFAATTEEGETFVLGLQETVDKSAFSQMQTLKWIISDIAESTDSNLLAQIVSSIKNLMSDRAATQVKFNTLFEAWRLECLPIAKSNWLQLTQTEREQLSRVNAFFCNLHLLASFAERIVDCMALAETAHSDLQVDADSCSVMTLLRDVAKYFSLRSAAKWGIYSKWLDFLRLKGARDAPSLPSFLGHRFNIMFLLAARIFQIRNLLIEFCEEFIPNNTTVATIAPRLRDPFIIAQLKVLGLLDKLVTGPLWRVFESPDIHILDLSGEFRELVDWLGVNVTDPSDFLRGSGPQLASQAESDGLLESLLSPTEQLIDEHLPIIAKQVMLTAQGFFSLIVKDFLDGGQFSDSTDSVLRAETKSVLKTNRIPESVFGLADWLFNRAPNMTMLSREALVLVIKNKTFDWLNSLNAEQKQAEITAATMRSSALRSIYLQRKAAMLEMRRANLLQAKEAAQLRHLHGVRVRSDLTKQVVIHGLWANEIEMTDGLGRLSSRTAKTKAIEVQLRFRRLVLKQRGDRKLFSMSEKGCKHSLEKLCQNLTALMLAAQQIAPVVSDPLQILHRRINHRFEENGEERWWPGTVTRLAQGGGSTGSAVYLIVYDTDRSVEYPITAEDLILDRDNGDFVIV